MNRALLEFQEMKVEFPAAREILIRLEKHFKVTPALIMGGGPDNDVAFNPSDSEYIYWPTIMIFFLGCPVRSILDAFALRLLWERRGGIHKAEFSKTAREVYEYARKNVLKEVLEK